MFKNLVDGIYHVGNMMTANISPYKVQLVKPDTYDGKTVEKKGKYFTLYKIPGCFECIFANTNASTKCFSVFRLSKDVEAFTLFRQLDKTLTDLVAGTSSVYEEAKVQLACDTVRQHPTWNSAHVAAYIGVFETFKDPKVKKLINDVDSVSGISPLMAGIIGRQKHCMHEMLVNGAEVDKADFVGHTAYHYAVKYLPEVLDFLFDHDKHKTYDWTNEKGHTALYKACMEAPEPRPQGEAIEKSVAVEMLLEGGADPYITNSYKRPIHEAVELGELSCIELILKKHPSQRNARDKKFQGCPLHWSKTRDVTELLCRLGCDVDTVSGTNHTPLQVMLMFGRKESLMELLCYGANVNIGDSNGDTPLHFAVKSDDIDLTRTFVVFGADVNQPNNSNHTPRHMAAISKKSKNNEVILHMLHVSGAKRCSTDTKGCVAGCSMEGTNNGKPEEKSKKLFQLDKMALFDDMLCTAVSCSAMMESGKGEALLDLTDGPIDVGDRVLCLDGGGIRGLVLIQLLAAIEEAADTPVHELFDWVGGTSTGGLLALAMGIGKPLPYIRGMYFRLKDQVFNGSRPYDSIPFENLLKVEIGETRVMTDIKHPKVMVTGVLADRFPAELHLFRSYQPTLDKPTEPHGRGQTFEPIKAPHEQLMWKCARSTGAAPTYFRAFGQFMDGGMISNNPTLDVLTEIHEYNTGLKFRQWCEEQKKEPGSKRNENEREKVRPLGVVVSLGCGRPPKVRHDHFDVYKPSSPLEIHKVYKGTTALLQHLIEGATVAEGRPVDRARAWCSMINVPFYRFSPQLSEDIALDCTDNESLINMLWDTQCYIVANHHRIQQVAQLLKAGKQATGHVGGDAQHLSSVQGVSTDLKDLKLHAAS
ncbi:85/88 kDa calcium-independent phospholipase A2-like isoform X2 [Mya arenaria]|uniref:85/88 kDa calcium-independent phospholipase A2-like isoform X2 n=1 Tax=Mya arenaria TaxID=6604 RepID=UPI0022E538ED|nr:85/88 kDa calcium-independent phospholipase A2-like isoform X2 [Mya arenaria]